MPVVRELVNRIGFKINRGELADAENAFKKLSTRAAIGLAGVTTAGSKMFVDFKKDTADVNFFANNKKEAEELLKLTNQITEASETTSRREARAAARTVSTFNVNKKLLEEILPFVEKISIARPSLDFTDVANSLEDVIKGGNIQALLDLVPGIKDELEILSKTSFQTPFADITEEQRAELVIKTLRENRARLTELVAEQKQQIPFFVERVSKESSDFFLNFGETTAPAMMELLELISTTIKEINESEAFWSAIETSAEAVTKAFILTKETIAEINEKGILGFGKDIISPSEEFKEDFLKNVEKNIEQNKTGEKTTQGLIDEAKVFVKDIFDFAIPSFKFFDDEPEDTKINKSQVGDSQLRYNENQGIGGGLGLFTESEMVLKGEKTKLSEAIESVGSFFEGNLRQQFQTGGNIAPALKPLEQDKNTQANILDNIPGLTQKESRLKESELNQKVLEKLVQLVDVIKIGFTPGTTNSALEGAGLKKNNTQNVAREIKVVHSGKVTADIKPFEKELEGALINIATNNGGIANTE